MSEANIFTEEFRSNLPQSVKTLLDEHNIEIVFKHEAASKLADGKHKSKTGIISSYKTLTKTLKPLCNPPITDAQIAAGDAADICHTQENRNVSPGKTKKKWGERHVRRNVLHNIGSTYLTTNINSALNTEYFDMIVLISKLPNDNPSKTAKNENAVGFLISQLGECHAELKYASIPALNLICAPKKHKCNHASCPSSGCGFIGRILIFMYLYALKQQKFKYGILELAGVYCNMGGLCLYNKFGFREDISMKYDDCFGDPANLSMVCDLNKINTRALEDALLLNQNINLPDSEPLCSKRNPPLSIAEQNEEVDRRFENYKNILELQSGTVTTADIKDDFMRGEVPDQKKAAVKALSKLSQQGNAVFNKFLPKHLKTTTQRTKRRRSPGSLGSPSERRVTRSMKGSPPGVRGGWKVSARYSNLYRRKPKMSRKKYRK